MMKTVAIVLIILVASFAAMAQDLRTIQLPAPDTTGGKPLMQVLKERHSTREYSADTISLGILSNLLWAANGVNRAGEGKRTAPSAMNWQETDVYVTTARGLFLYDPLKHALVQVLSEDIRGNTGMQPFVKDVPVNLIYVADMAKASRGSESDRQFYTAADAAFVAENVYLFCASEGLATVVRGSVDREALAKLMNLRPEQKIMLTQSVGYPKK